MGTGDQRHTSAALPLEKNAGTNSTGSCVALVTGLEMCGDKISCYHRGSYPDPSNPQRVHVPTTLSRALKYQENVSLLFSVNLLNPTGYVMHQQFNIQQLYALPTLYLCVLYLSQNKQRLVPLTS